MDVMWNVVVKWSAAVRQVVVVGRGAVVGRGGVRRGYSAGRHRCRFLGRNRSRGRCMCSSRRFRGLFEERVVVVVVVVVVVRDGLDPVPDLYLLGDGGFAA